MYSGLSIKSLWPNRLSFSQLVAFGKARRWPASQSAQPHIATCFARGLADWLASQRLVTCPQATI